jgi:PAS domain S-box-containing protein
VTDPSRTNKELLQEISILQGRIRELKQSEADRKKTVETLRDTETRYRLLFEHSPNGIVIIDPAKARFLEFNDTAHRQLGYSREEFARLSISDLDIFETPEETRSQIAKVMQEGRHDFETMHRTRQGEIRNIHVTAQFTEILGHPVYHCIWRDITEPRRAEEALRESEEKYRLLIEMLPLAVFVDAQGKIVYVNPAFLTLFKASSRDEIIGMRLIEFIPPELFDTIEEGRRIMTEEKHTLPPLELNIRCKDGTVITVVLTPIPIIFQEQPVILSALYDITERKRSEIELQKAYKLLQIQSRQIEDLQAQLKEQAIRS